MDLNGHKTPIHEAHCTRQFQLDGKQLKSCNIFDVGGTHEGIS